MEISFVIVSEPVCSPDSAGARIPRAWIASVVPFSVLIDRLSGLLVLLALALVGVLLYPQALPPWIETDR